MTYDSYTKLLLHMDGSNGGTTFTDESGKTVTVYGNTNTSTAQKEFGTASAHFPYDYITMNYLELIDSDDWTFGTGDFTIDFWVNFKKDKGTGGSGEQQVNDFVGNNDGTYGFRIYFQDYTGVPGNRRLGWCVQYNTSSMVGAEFSADAYSSDTWYHVALVRYGNNLYLYINGTQILTKDVTGVTLGNSTYPLEIGIDPRTQPCIDYNMNGYMDEVRISKGIARWTSNFTPPTSAYAPTKNAKVLVVAGGGGGGGGASAGGGGGGGGAGGFIYNASFAITPQVYSVVVGVGGNKGSGGTDGSNGGNSVFDTLTTVGGGGGGASKLTGDAGKTGGSGGGGGAGGSGGPGSGGSGTGGQGYGGGTGVVNSGGGGGGASEIGHAAESTSDGVGGAGTANSISGSSIYYAGGGGGSQNSGDATSGGNGGGGAAGYLLGGVTPTAAIDGTANKGGGGGGGLNTYYGGSGNGGSGGSGIVIVRWTTAEFGTCSVTGTGNAITTSSADSIATFIISGNLVMALLGLANVKTIYGIPMANIKTINGIPIANIKSINGIT